jgi:predicted SAM-dependent methyltransferase
MVILDFGCKKNKVKGAIGVDINSDSDADVIHDFEKKPFPFPDNSADLIYAKHILEHLNNPCILVQEAIRILKPGGNLIMEVPHFSNYVAYSDLEHKRYFSYFTFRSLLGEEQLKKTTRLIRFYKTFRFFGLQKLFNKYPEQYERFWTYLFPAETIIAVLEK